MVDHEKIREIAGRLKLSDRRGLLSRDGSGAFTIAVLDRLSRAGLMDPYSYFLTDLGWRVRLVISPKDHDAAQRVAALDAT